MSFFRLPKSSPSDLGSIRRLQEVREVARTCTLELPPGQVLPRDTKLAGQKLLNCPTAFHVISLIVITTEMQSRGKCVVGRGGDHPYRQLPAPLP